MAGSLISKCQHFVFLACRAADRAPLYSYGSLVPRLKVEDEIRFDCTPIAFIAGVSASGKLGYGN